eukprot:TRINITY_DN24927_c0_g1_i1.p1 TRINITY_DN24927_c0_g1~~TRINITY_DN24927_c0_g1_i1.p1  ORF type:complete len:220 (+),score=31.73 TRINITY_DN24927_c0_g1_i1:82-660(+)
MAEPDWTFAGMAEESDTDWLRRMCGSPAPPRRQRGCQCSPGGRDRVSAAPSGAVTNTPEGVCGSCGRRGRRHARAGTRTGCAQIVALPADRPAHVAVTFSDESGRTRTLLICKEKIAKLRCKGQRGQQQLADGAERQHTPSFGDPNWADWMVEAVDDGNENAQATRQLYSSKSTGQQIRAGSAEQAAKKPGG